MSEQNYANVYRSRKRMLLDNFLGGMFWSFGTLIGGALILVVIGIILSRIDLVPIIGGWLHQILQEAYKNQPVKGLHTP